MKNVTFALEESVLEAARETARARGQSLNEWVRELLRREVSPDPSEELREAWRQADADGLRLEGPMPSREERNGR